MENILLHLTPRYLMQQFYPPVRPITQREHGRPDGVDEDAVVAVSDHREAVFPLQLVGADVRTQSQCPVDALIGAPSSYNERDYLWRVR